MQFSTTTQSLMSRSLHQWQKADNNELIEFILERYHALHREQLPQAIQLARRVEQAHAGDPNCPEGLAEHLSDMFQELESHMMKEEQILFPMLSTASYPQGPIMVMESEHDEHELALQHIEKITNNLTLPAGACGTWTALYDLLAELVQDLREHIELESRVLFVPEEQLAGRCCGGCQ
ncbi:MAG: hemerythrin domain-containing protein [Aliidiomarina sp.]|uniref:hemerythrin domain-containing protein n=1 Tax=Aliidiomarina sp. TaxID=1872439 RepID=UPI0025BB9911|nr:hemerythrin domain-containing protein [Aliidiomarina sp.]MCH8501136.1 hemerythrin domain-containing protein [Aliidiomarina sp.]